MGDGPATRRPRRTAPTTERRYPKLETVLPPYVHARLQAVAMILGVEPAQIVERGLQAEQRRMSSERRELVDRVAASLIPRCEIEDLD